MPSTVPPPRRKSCDHCIRAKRRCDLNSPCSRCSEKGLDCSYKSIGSTKRAQHTAAVQVTTTPPRVEIDRDTTGTSSAGSSDVASDAGVTSHSGSIQVAPPVWNTSIDGPDTLQPLHTISFPERLNYVNAHLKNFSEVFLETGSLHFLHIKLYDGELPQAITQAFSVCAVLHSRNAANYGLANSAVGAIALQIVRGAPKDGASMRDKVAIIQALIILQTARIFDGDIRQRALADRDQGALLEHTRDLYQLVHRSSQPTAPSWKEWLLLESVRRTIIVALLLHGIYKLNRSGQCPTTPGFVKAQPFSASPEMWQAKTSYEWEMAKSFTPAPWLGTISLNTVERALQASDWRPNLDEFVKLLVGLQFGEEGIARWQDGCNTLGPESSPSVKH
jgi:hypothetical protein